MLPRNVIIATVLTIALLIGWNYMFPPTQEFLDSTMGDKAQKTAETQAKEAEQAALPAEVQARVQAEQDAGQDGAPAKARPKPVEFRPIKVTTPLYEATWDSARATLTHFKLLKYKETMAEDSPYVDLITDNARRKGPLGLLINGRPTWRRAEWRVEGGVEGGDLDISKGGDGTLVFSTELQGLKVTRTLSFSADTYLIEETVVGTPVDSAMAPDTKLGFSIASGKLSSGDDSFDLTEITYYNEENGLTEEDDIEELAPGFIYTEGLQWAGVESNYFLLAAAPETTSVTLKGKYEDEVYRVAVDKTVAPGEDGLIRYNTAYYVGPKEKAILDLAPHDLGKAVNLGWFDFIAKPLMWGLNFFYGYVGNYGIAIILLTICIKILFWPLSHKSYKSMNQMKKLQPMMAKIREKYKGDRQKMNAEMMGLYKTYKVNPAGGCVPMLVQIPVFIGLYQALLNSIELRHAPFIVHFPFTDYIWLADLSAKDPYYITPIIMGASMLLQQKLSPAPGDPMQAKLMMLMPVFFTFLFLSFPCGLVVYWLVNNLLSIFQQWMMLRKA
jgi:YidC/Oxa1 family membrane protein insertase